MSIRTAIFGICFVTAAGGASAQSPMSAIDWLSDSLNTPQVVVKEPETAVTGGVDVETITVAPLGEQSADGVGLLPTSVTGLPADLWGTTASADLASRLSRMDTDILPALRDLLFILLLAEVNPPSDSGSKETLFLARIDTLLTFGAVEEARALLERAGTDDPAHFRRWFDAALLTGTEDAACEILRRTPDLSPTFPARIFCLARGGDWEAAALTLETGEALGFVDEADAALLARFLDPAMAETASALPTPLRPSPLTYRLYEAIGETLPTARLPIAFSHADLRANAGWKAQIEAAERLARSGSVPENRLLGLYTERRPAASGGVWDRADLVQRFDVALTSRDPGAVGDALGPAWRSVSSIELEVVFAKLYGDKMAGLPLTGNARDLAFQIGLLSNGYEIIARRHTPRDAQDRFLIGLAQGSPDPSLTTDPIARAIADGFATTEIPTRLRSLIDENRLGEAILRAIGLFMTGANGDLDELTDAIAFFRAVGLENVARRASLQALILDRRG